MEEKFMKKFLAILLALVLCFACVACAGGGDDKETTAASDGAESTEAAAKTAEVKVGFIYLHDENSTYDKNFIDAAKAACEAQGVEYINKVNIPEGNECLEAANELVDEGCNIIFADSFGHEDYMIQAAKAHEDVQFCHATGVKAHTENLKNYHNAFASIYEGRYLAGVAAGMKLNEMIKDGKIKEDEAKMGYVGAFTYAEVISGYTSFYLGAKSICPSVTMDVQFTGSWYDETAEKEAANTLIKGGCVLMSQHADSMGAPTACEEAGVPDVSYNGSTVSACPKTFIVSSKINWQPYMEYMIECVKNGEEIKTDWVGTIATESVQLTDINEEAAAEGTADKIAEVKKGLEDGSIKVFDTSTFTVDGKAVDTKEVDGQEVVADGEFQESKVMSAPYFDLRIDGINLLNEDYGD